MDATRRRYAVVVLAVLAIGLGAGEWFIRDSVAEAKAMTSSQRFVLKVLTAEGSDVVAGDSHVGLRERHPPYVFLGRGGITPWELEQALRSYFRDRPVGRVMIEVGPQQVAANRQFEWRSLARNSLVRQFLPFDVYLFEPELVSVAEQRVTGLFKRAAKSAGRPAKPSRKKPEARENRREQAAYAAWPEEVRALRMLNRASEQRPVDNFEVSVAWQAQERMIRRLKTAGGEVCLIRTPLTREYQQRMTETAEEWGFARYRRAIETLAKELEVPYVDYLDLGLGDMPLVNFKNQDHLSPRGDRVYWPAVEKACFPGA